MNRQAGISRRRFLRCCGTCAALFPILSQVPLSACRLSMPVAVSFNEKRRTRIKAVYAYPDPAYPNWPNIGFDFEGTIDDIRRKLERYLPEIAFQHQATMDGSAVNGKKIIEESGDVDGYLIFLVGCLWGDLTETIASCGKPVVIADHLYAGSGEFLTSYARVKRAGFPVLGISSSDFLDVVRALRAVQVIKELAESTVLVIGAEADTALTEVYGTMVRKIGFEEINRLYNAVDGVAARKVASDWIYHAEEVIEPAEAEIVKAAAMYHAMKGLLDTYGAQAVTVNCLGGIYSGQMVEAYPCLGFMQLDDEGLVGACEADQRSTMTKLIMNLLVRRPGFISDPVIDTSKNRIIYAHCVAPTRMYGYYGPANPYQIRDHSEDRKGACNRSLMPLGDMTTTLLFDHHKKQVILHQGVAVENVDDDKACRNKLAVEVQGDIRKLMEYWDEWGWHRVTFYGDLKNEVYNMATLMGFKVVEEA